ncbi:gluconate 2-dehydrogenase subunit 3 family protein [Microbacterium horticulturae]|uniref:Gluconate 2-dehydrogenase subunit 3 family protein n=1 Tax=Microbacterium horticulturae TaxID=3028316 RepID=A0ABY8BUX3_9MICO|nr:gluconate 2-dehydrogenase subunit 3 family protein [Microbacterium sp. KACC 23027]WEG07976.1 gluconate 2-dehydrogenase subunit 3 family protein [Microbacterium sp. KACC 23027]
MTLPLDPESGGGRFPGFDVLAHAAQWDQATQAVVAARAGRLPDPRFFTPDEEATARALFDQLLDQREDPRVPVFQLVDTRLAEEQTDGWHYADLPPDDVAWRNSLAFLDDDARTRCGQRFAECAWDDQSAILNDINAREDQDWHGYAASRVWSLWTRYACTAFYSHPSAWDEIGFDGPAYPRGYKNIGVDRLEGFEVHDAHPELGPAAPSEHAQSEHAPSEHSRSGHAPDKGEQR